jgi:hypothetical protein
VSTPTTRLQAHNAAAQQLIGKAAEMWVAAGEQSDCEEGLGCDGRIALVHGLCDLWVKGWATLAECIIAGPPSLCCTSEANEPLPSETIEVAPTSYPRQIEAEGSFKRVGLNQVTLPPSAIGFDPPFLPAGVTQFQIVLLDDNYAGANYMGKIKLSTQSLVPDEIEVTVGL